VRSGRTNQQKNKIKLFLKKDGPVIRGLNLSGVCLCIEADHLQAKGFVVWIFLHVGLKKKENNGRHFLTKMMDGPTAVEATKSDTILAVVRAQCQSRNSPGFDTSILRHGAADEPVLNIVHKKIKKIPLLKLNVPRHLYSYSTLLIILTERFVDEKSVAFYKRLLNCIWFYLRYRVYGETTRVIKCEDRKGASKQNPMCCHIFCRCSSYCT
jgi:hypothetical protein